MENIKKTIQKLNEALHDYEHAEQASANIRNEALAKTIMDQARQALEHCMAEAVRAFMPKEEDVLPALPPKEKEEFSSMSESEDSNYDDGEHQAMEEQVFEEDGFEVSDNASLEYFESSEYDQAFNEPEPRVRRSSRKRKKSQRYEDVPESEQYGDEPVKNLDDPEEDPAEEAQRFTRLDLRECKILVRSLRNGASLQNVLVNSPWFQKRYGHILDTIRNNLGQDGHNQECHLLWDHVAEDAYENQNPPRIEEKRLAGLPRGNVECHACNCKRNCRWTLWLRHRGRPVGTTCGALIQAVAEFFLALHQAVQNEEGTEEDMIKELDLAMTRIQEAHAQKG